MLVAAGAKVVDERPARKEPLTDKEARALLKQVSKVSVARGRKIVELPVAEAKLADLKGPSGNYRAPMIRKGKRLLVGFNVEALETLL